ncbi:hypothetical protein KM908_14380 [Alkalihalobacillus clausii]|uniref:hypothetical protein n=1 Tax=Shouchella clausii TaxID=79880 RepID=UPI001C21CAB5|nr:hypothetical protein [Shouchella clausii]MBU8597329.1 hypothetical protein [Shouchella clausii]
MAKLSGVKIVDMTAGEVMKVAYEGAEYERAEHPIKETDLILNESDYSPDLSVGAFYKVILVDDDGDVKFKDDTGDMRYRDDYDHDLIPFRKVSAQGPTIEARVGKLESDVAALKGEQEAEEKPLAVGDYAKVVPHNNDIGFGGSPGDIVIIRDKRVDRYRTKELSGGNYHGNPWVKTEGLVRATDGEVVEAKAAQFEVGDYIVPLPIAEKYWITNSDMRLGKVVDKLSAFIDIEIVAHKNEEEVGEVYMVSAEHFRKATVEEISEAKAAMKPLFNVGDYAKVVGRTYLGDIAAGTVVKITKEADEDGDYKIVLLDESNYDYAQASSLEKVDADKAETINKWSKIGREVDEYKEGDVVRVLDVKKSFAFDLSRGEINVITKFCDNDSFQVGSGSGWVGASQVELVAPVESRVDR